MRLLVVERDTHRFARIFEHKAVAAEYRGDESEQLQVCEVPTDAAPVRIKKAPFSDLFQRRGENHPD